MDVTAPAVLFPTISLLLLAYTNRFLALAALIRSLYDRHQSHPDEILVAQIRTLRHRVRLIRDMQAFGVLGRQRERTLATQAWRETAVGDFRQVCEISRAIVCFLLQGWRTAGWNFQAVRVAIFFFRLAR